MTNYQDLFTAFLDSSDTLRIYSKDKLIFSSEKDRLMPLMEYLKQSGRGEEPVIIFDKVIGNAAACLAVKAHAREVYSPLGSELGIKTLEKHKITHHLDSVVPYIMRDDGQDMCPMEKLSIDKTPEEFYQEMKKRIEGKK
jgi:hypothetical protein